MPTLLEGVPVALLPLLSDDSSTPKPSTPSSSNPLSAPSSTGSVNASSQHLSSMPLVNKPQSTISRAPAPHSPPSASRSGLRNFQFLPIYPTEDNNTSHESDASSHDQDSDHTMPSPTSTPSLTSSNNSPPSTPSASPSPLETSLSSATTLIDSYFDLPLQQPTASVRTVDLSRMHHAGLKNPGGVTATGMPHPTSKNLTLRTLGNPGLMPPSPFDLQGSISQGQYLHERTQQDGLKRGAPGKHKEPARRFFYTGGDDDVDEPFFPLERKDRKFYPPIPPAKNPNK
jgi:hypothetical protein